MSEHAWIIYRPWEGKLAAHKAACKITDIRFIPVFRTRNDARTYRDKRLQMPSLKIRRVSIEHGGAS